MNACPILPAPNDRAAYLYAGATVLIWSTVATAFKLALRHMTPFHLMCVAVPVSFLVLLACSLGSGRLRALRQISGADLARCAVLGCLNPFLYYLILFKAYDLLPAQVAQPVNYTWGIMLAFLSVPLLGHRLVKGEIPAALVSYAGVVVIALGGGTAALGGASLGGIGLALASTLIWAVYWVYGARSRLDPLLGLSWNFFFATLLLAASVPFFSSYAELAAVVSSLGPWHIAPAVYVGFFEMGISFFLWMKAMQLTSSASRISMLIYFAPFLSLIFIRLVLGENIRLATLAGLACIICGSLLHKRAVGRAASRAAQAGSTTADALAARAK